MIIILIVSIIISHTIVDASTLKTLENCPDGWTQWNHKCYWNGENATFAENKRACDEKNAQLVIIENAEENEAILTFLRDKNVRANHWLNAKRVQRGVFKFKWGNGNEFTYQNWFPGEPEEIDKENVECVIFGADGRWWDVPCDEKRAQLCQMVINKPHRVNSTFIREMLNLFGKNSLEVPQIQNSPIVINCNNETRKCYSIYKDFKTFDESKQSCESLGGKLVEIHSEAENKFVARHTFFKSTYWIGSLRIFERSPYFAHVSGQSFTFDHWAPTEPKDDVTANCVHFRHEQWLTGDCNKRYPYICENSFDGNGNSTSGFGTTIIDRHTGQINNLINITEQVIKSNQELKEEMTRMSKLIAKLKENGDSSGH